MYNQGILEFSNQSHSIPKTAGPPKNFDLFNKFQRKDAFLEKKKKTHRSQNTNLEYILLNLVLWEMQKRRNSL